MFGFVGGSNVPPTSRAPRTRSPLFVPAPGGRTYGSVPMSSAPRPGSHPLNNRSFVPQVGAPQPSGSPPSTILHPLGHMQASPFRSSPQGGFAIPEKEKEDPRAPFVCEFLGTAFFAFTVCCCKYGGHQAWNPVVIGCSFMVLTYAVGPVSGGNLNPAVSLTLAILGKLPFPAAVGYMAVQVMGAIVGTNAAKFALFYHVKPHIWVAPIAPFNWQEAGAVEVLFTAMLCFVFANCTASQKNKPKNDQNQFYGLAIGLSIIAGLYSAANISGGYLNPAVAVSLNSPFLKGGMEWGFTYAGYEMIGAIVGSILYCICRPTSEDDEDDPNRNQFGVQAHFLGSRIASEFLGTFFLVSTIGFNLVMGTKATPLAAAAALTSMVYSVGRVCGGHFNPAVTFAVVLAGRNKCCARDGSLYAIAQTAAGLTAGLVVATVHGFAPKLSASSFLGERPNYTWWESFCAETAFTALLAYVVLTVTTSAAKPSLTRQNFYFGLAIGACYLVGGLAVGAISGGVLNPAVASGVAMESSLIVNNFGMLWHPVAAAHGVHALHFDLLFQLTNVFRFTAAELVGGALAAGVFRLSHPQEFEITPKTFYRSDDPTHVLL